MQADDIRVDQRRGRLSFLLKLGNVFVVIYPMFGCQDLEGAMALQVIVQR